MSQNAFVGVGVNKHDIIIILIIICHHTFNTLRNYSTYDDGERRWPSGVFMCDGENYRDIIIFLQSDKSNRHESTCNILLGVTMLPKVWQIFRSWWSSKASWRISNIRAQVFPTLGLKWRGKSKTAATNSRKWYIS